MAKTRILMIGLCLSVQVLAAKSAGAQAIEPAFRADIERLMVTTGAANLATQMATSVAGQILDGMKRSRADIPERMVTIAKEVLNEEIVKAATAPDGLQFMMVQIYATHFTHDDVRGLIAFYETDLGKKMVAKMPVLMQDGASMGQQWAVAHIPRITSILDARLKAEGFIIK